MAGGLLWCVLQRDRRIGGGIRSARGCDALALAGLAILVTAFIVLSPQRHYPGAWALMALGFLGSYRTSSVSLSVVPVAERDGGMERDYWYTAGRGLSDLLEPEEVGRIAAERTLRRLGARKVPTCEVPIVFDQDAAAELMGHVYHACSGYGVFRNATFLKGRLGEVVASPLLSVVDEGRRPRILVESTAGPPVA